MLLTLINDSNKVLNIEASLVPKKLKSRLNFAFKNFSIFFLLALGSVFLPVAHFVLVPAFLFVSVFIFFKKLSILNYLVVDGEYHCISCHKILEMPSHLNEDLILRCEKCFQQYQVTL